MCDDANNLLQPNHSSLGMEERTTDAFGVEALVNGPSGKERVRGRKREAFVMAKKSIQKKAHSMEGVPPQRLASGVYWGRVRAR